MSRRHSKKKKNEPCMEGSRTEYCPHFLECGGCKYQKMTYEEQLHKKERDLRELFTPVLMDVAKRNGIDDPDFGAREFERVWEGMKRSPAEEGYRGKMEFSFGDEYLGGPLALGMHKRGSHFDIVSVTDCRIAHPDMTKILGITLEYFGSREIPFFHRVRHDGYLRHLLVRRAYHTGEILVDLITTGNGRLKKDLLGPDTLADHRVMTDEKEDELILGWKEAILSADFEGDIAGILHTRNDRIADVVEDQGTEMLYGESGFTEELLGLKFRISPFSFFQTNSAGAEVLYDTARSYLSGEYDTIYDLYSGTGTITQLMSPAAREVVGVELIPEAVEAAIISAGDNNISNCRFIAGDVLKVLDELPEKPQAIILDPPRDGVNPKALKKILGYGVESIVYIACRPASLARDYEVFYHAGYRMERLCGVDMFPFTGEVETVCLLGRRKPNDTIKVSVNMDDYYQIRDVEEAEKNPS